ncbi:PaaI family thioesterase [Rhodococcus artemisiae]|uniref:Acyl-coenzyme A thioesterase THEM4 n=1 Tax=Rhodococcus artemisiae TaxID=714159 RepID=A0ABU7LG06_9NOCA|nr:PaaI family thioesterase [Rhodococcus artemisiae]MEE2060489.1 PaaI family thioesterase [Rhodococcus artemisiae]
MDTTVHSSAPVDIWHPDWNDPFDPTAEAGDEFAELVDAVRAVQEAFTRSRTDPAAARSIAEQLRSVARSLGKYEVGEDDQIAGHRWDLAGRGQALAPPLHIDEVTDTTARGRVTVGRFHAGRYAMNGGVTPLIFDEIMARLANDSGRAWARTAYLTVNFRAPAPLDVELRVEAQYLRRDGRKRFMTGAMYHGDVLVADADGLWIELKAEQTLNISEGRKV